jgi:hypothetical protein
MPEADIGKAVQLDHLDEHAKCAAILTILN